MELLLFILFALLCWILVATLILSLLLFTAMLLQMYRILIQQNDASRYTTLGYHCLISVFMAKLLWLLVLVTECTYSERLNCLISNK